MKVDSIKLLSILFGGQKEFKAVMATCGVDTDTVAEQYDPTKTYLSGDLVIYNDVLYAATDSTTGTFDPTKWNEINIAAILKDIEERLSNLSTLGRYLAIWDCTTGLPTTNPTTLPYDYIRGDYFIIGIVGTTNYMPSGAQYTGVASTTIDPGTPHVLGMYRYDGTSWSWLDFGEEFRTILENYYTKDQVDTFLNGKQATISDLGTIREGAAAGATALQPSALTLYRTSSAQDQIDAGKENTTNKVTKISSSSTDTQYPSAKAVYSYIQSLDGNEVSY